MEDVLELYAEPYDPERPVVCFDEKSLQLLEETRPSQSVAPGEPARHDYEYKRQGKRISSSRLSLGWPATDKCHRTAQEAGLRS